MAQAEIIWSDIALADLEGIRAYIAQFNPRAANRIALEVIAAAESLAQFPQRGRAVGPGRRELVTVWPYVIQYRTTEGRVEIVRVQHGRRRRSANF
ncbi:MAG: type II toxin-antitoxin system RelE/ParE family toxin [Stellaceae bacterium]